MRTPRRRMGNLFQTETFEDQVHELKFNLGIEIKSRQGDLSKLEQKMKKEMDELKGQLMRSQGELNADMRRKAMHIERMTKAKSKLSEVKSTLQGIELELDTAMQTASLTQVATEASQVYTALGRQVPTHIVKKLAMQRSMATSALETKLEALSESNDDIEISEDDTDSAPVWLRTMCDEVRQASLQNAVDAPRHEPRVRATQIVRASDAVPGLARPSDAAAASDDRKR